LSVGLLTLVHKPSTANDIVNPTGYCPGGFKNREKRKKTSVLARKLNSQSWLHLIFT
jgi:hypothetical protein